MGVQLPFFVIGSPSFPLFVVTAVLGAALLLFLADFEIFMIFTWTFPLLPLSVFWSAGVVAAAQALRLFALLTVGFLLFLLLLLSGGFL